MAEYNASDSRQVKGRKDQERRELSKNEDAFKYVMEDVRGRNFVWWVLSSTGIFKDPFTTMGSMTDYNCGKAGAGRYIQVALEEICPKEFITMWQEHLVSQEKDKKEDEAIRINGNGEEF